MDFWYCLSLVSTAVINTIMKSNLVRKGFFFPQSICEASQGRNLAEADFLSTAGSAWTTAQDQCLGPLPPMHCTLPHKLLISRKCPTDSPKGQPAVGIFLAEVPSSPMTLAMST